jgi:hypothetical protein
MASHQVQKPLVAKIGHHRDPIAVASEEPLTPRFTVVVLTQLLFN